MKRVNLVVAATVGTTLEWYDFCVFAPCSVLVFDKAFFAAANPFVASLLSLGWFSVGFLARPLGGILFGIAGDRFGRKTMLVVAVSALISVHRSRESRGIDFFAAEPIALGINAVGKPRAAR